MKNFAPDILDSLDLECSRGPGKMAASQFKNFLYAFCGKRKVRPIYAERPATQGTFKFQVKLLFIATSSLRYVEMFISAMKAGVARKSEAFVIENIILTCKLISLDKFVGMLLRGDYIYAWGSLFL